MMSRWGLVLILLLTACSATVSVDPGVASSSKTASDSRTGPPSPPSTPTRSDVLAVVAGPNNTLSLAGMNGAILATANVAPAPFRPNSVMSWTSSSLKRVYYLNGGYEVRFLGPDGSTGLATQIKVRQNEEAGFAVSPDDKRIAVAIFNYTASADSSQAPAYNGMRLYVENLQGGGRHLDIFDSPTAAEFPIGWTGGNLVIAVSTPQCCRTQPTNPYGATTYHVVNPDTGRRVLALCTDSHVPVGPVETFGVMCTELGAQFWSWDGTALMAPAAIPLPSDRLNAVSPDGRRVAVAQQYSGIWGPYGGSYSLDISGYVYGWLDGDHIIIKKEGSTSLSIYDLQARRSAEVPDSASYMGRFPTSLS
jgi:hypothetical protein